MPTTETAELYFIAGAFVLILIICGVATYVFFRQLRREKNSSQEEAISKEDTQTTAAEEEQ
ncbi:MAG: hypothetical protein DWQ47_02760 [Acidobacteria bacterium]|nr:MAG: hypothetical protein DWQ32_06310 [Acidobacteriota bacterium]REK01331.1 MAG: hypothetical protein DWQ38_02745 [Acidobacteriota bacterium]REK14287.1 MAG: hypothetical protein DWQ43_12000 [Acidobacteriota bacterium]REK45002.1 MAG: hypothetical protein DWQ47_02760 [Acidobacteriota bacterium]